MILVDTSIWIAVFRKKDPLWIEQEVDFDELVTCLPVIQEVLKGFREEKAFRTAQEAMRALPAVESPMEESLFLEAVNLYRMARRRGLTVRSSIDCLIAACALRHNLPMLHIDRGILFEGKGNSEIKMHGCGKALSALQLQDHRFPLAHGEPNGAAMLIEKGVHSKAHLRKEEGLTIPHPPHWREGAFEKPVSRPWVQPDFSGREGIEIVRGEPAARERFRRNPQIHVPRILKRAKTIPEGRGVHQRNLEPERLEPRHDDGEKPVLPGKVQYLLRRCGVEGERVQSACWPQETCGHDPAPRPFRHLGICENRGVSLLRAGNDHRFSPVQISYLDHAA
jgi:predicted nucleic acid-binding protein